MKVLPARSPVVLGCGVGALLGGAAGGAFGLAVARRRARDEKAKPSEEDEATSEDPNFDVADAASKKSNKSSKSAKSGRDGLSVIPEGNETASSVAASGSVAAAAAPARDPLPGDLARVRESGNSEVFDALIKIWEATRSSADQRGRDSFAGLCRAADNLLDLHAVVTDPNTRVIPVMQRKGSTYLAVAKARILELSQGLQAPDSLALEEATAALVDELGACLQNVLAEVSLRM